MTKKIGTIIRGFCAAFPFICFLHLGTVHACDEQCERFLQQKASDARLGRQTEKDRIESLRRYEQHHQNNDELNRLRKEQLEKMAMREKVLQSNGHYKPPEREGDTALLIREQAAAQVAQRNKRLDEREEKFKTEMKEFENQRSIQSR